MRLLLVNGTDDTVAFDACDSRLSIIQEAKDESGEWRAIEYLPRSWCGNSYHRVLLSSGESWAFPAPRYDGALTTNLRFRLMDEGGETLLVSNEFKGKINTEQFELKQSFTPDAVMDPYFPVPSEEVSADSEPEGGA